ncbi:MAG: hypothetical protein IJT54_09780 [Candidatus Methanomethylophilaceae archaeon]|nr:hypothetical protein [Candidatus Methanomethylophilaceae archaeon]
MDKKWISIVVIVFIAMILIGEVLTYSSGVNRYDSDAVRNGASVNYSISSSGTNDYRAVLMDNGGFKGLERLAIYVDENYEKNLDAARNLTPIGYMEAAYYADQMQRSLKLRSFDNTVICDSKGLIEFLEETKANPKGCGILSISYALPGEIYTGSAMDPLMVWIGNGGSLYWADSVPGSLYYNNGELMFVNNSQELFFGANCINLNGGLHPDTVEKNYTKALCLADHQLFLGADSSAIVREHLSMGSMNGSIAAITLVRYGEGMVVQTAGSFRIEQIEDLSQILASGICYKSTIIDQYEGRVTRSTINGSFESISGDRLYLCIGSIYPVYGRAFDV